MPIAANCPRVKPVLPTRTLELTVLSAAGGRGGGVGHGGGETEAGQQGEGDEGQSPGETMRSKNSSALTVCTEAFVM